MSRFSGKSPLGRFLVIATVAVAVAAALGCSADGAATATPASVQAAAATAGPFRDKAIAVRLGYFPNITHAQPLAGLKRNVYQEALGSNVKLETRLFNAGPAAIEALFAGEVDIQYIGPNPAITGYVRSEGKALRIIAGSASGGALLVVRPDSGISTAADLANKKIATPQLGNTQDVALRSYLLANGLKPRENGGNVSVLPIANADMFTLFQKGDIHGAWVPEPWASRLLLQAGGKLVLDERTLWPGGNFVTTHVVVSTKFLTEHPDLVEKFLKAHIETTLWLQANPEEARSLVNQAIKDTTTAALPEDVIKLSWDHLTFTFDPLASSLRKSADDAFALNFLGSSKPDLSNIYALDTLNKLLREAGLPEVAK